MCFTTPPSRHDPEITVPARPISISHHNSRIEVITPPSHSHSAPKRSYSQSRARPAPTETRRLSSGHLVTVHTISPRGSGTQVVKREQREEWQRSPRHSGALQSPRYSGNVQYGGSPRHSGGLSSPRLSNRAIMQEIVPTSPRQSRTVIIAPPRQSGNSVHFQEEVQVLGEGRPAIVGRSSGSRRYSNSGGARPHYRSPRQSSVSVRSTREKMIEVDEDGREGRGWERRDERRW